MAVKLPSDLIVDVMRNADPVQRNSAVARLRSSGGEDTRFAAAVDQVGFASAHAATDQPEDRALKTSGPATSEGRKHASKVSALQGFEHMVLRNLFEVLLPDEKSGTFGEGPSAGVWRSMAADQLSGVYADSGGIGIAQMFNAGAKDAGPQRDAEWPYFASHPISTIGAQRLS